jgi:membrane protein implicated in regulation of membrane protease activity
VEWLKDSQWLWWIGAVLVLGLIEIASLDLVFIMLSIGALAGAGVALAGGSFPLQVLVATGTAGLLLVVVRPLALRKLKPAGAAQRTNAAAHVGRRAEVLRTVTDRGGLVKLTGEEWTARSAEPGHTFDVGEIVGVVAIDGATAVVTALTRTTDAPEA